MARRWCKATGTERPSETNRTRQQEGRQVTEDKDKKMEGITSRVREGWHNMPTVGMGDGSPVAGRKKGERERMAACDKHSSLEIWILSKEDPASITSQSGESVPFSMCVRMRISSGKNDRRARVGEGRRSRCRKTKYGINTTAMRTSEGRVSCACG